MLTLIACQLYALRMESKRATSSGMNRLKFAPANPLIRAENLLSAAKSLFSSSNVSNSRSSGNSTQFFGKAIHVPLTGHPDSEWVWFFEFKLLALINL